MGACVSRQASCVGRKPGSRKDGNIRRRKSRPKMSLKRRVSSDRSSDDRKIQSLPVDRPFNNPTFQGSAEEAWFESNTFMESDYSDEDFHSIPDDIHYASNPDTAPTNGALNASQNSSACNSARNSISGAAVSDSKATSDGHNAVFADEISCSSGEDGAKNEGLLDNCGITPSNCLPCLASTVPSIEKRKSFSSITVDMKKKSTPKLPFKWKEGHHPSSLVSSKTVVIRPPAGSQVPRCPLGKKVPDTWSEIEPGTFRVRGLNYFRDKKKELAPNSAAYYPFGLDVFLSQRKINHIARLVELPSISSSGKLPPILVVNVQIPLYPATIFQGETDGEGISFAIYCKLSESLSRDIPAHFQENIRKLIYDEVEKVKGFRTDTSIPFRERLKILGRVVNVDDLPMSGPERKLMHAYNEKPVLSRPQHDFYLGENYFEIDLDMHRFSYISRKGFETFLDRLKLCVLDFGLTIQGNRAEELPENVLCCIRLNEIDYSNYQQLAVD